MVILFKICCGIIYLISLITGFTYEEVNTILFIYGEPLILIITSFFITLISLIYFKQHIIEKIIFCLSIPYNTIMWLLTFLLWNYYQSLSLHEACVQAYKDLDYIGQITGMGYVNINLFLFIVLFLFILIFNIFIICICRYVKNLK